MSISFECVVVVICTYSLYILLPRECGFDISSARKWIFKRFNFGSLVKFFRLLD